MKRKNESGRLLLALIRFVQNFGAPSFDDKKLEVVAVFGSMQMAMSRVINLQHHRIAQVTHLSHFHKSIFIEILDDVPRICPFGEHVNVTA